MPLQFADIERLKLQGYRNVSYLNDASVGPAHLGLPQNLQQIADSMDSGIELFVADSAKPEIKQDINPKQIIVSRHLINLLNDDEAKAYFTYRLDQFSNDGGLLGGTAAGAAAAALMHKSNTNALNKMDQVEELLAIQHARKKQTQHLPLISRRMALQTFGVIGTMAVGGIGESVWSGAAETTNVDPHLASALQKIANWRDPMPETPWPGYSF